MATEGNCNNMMPSMQSTFVKIGKTLSFARRYPIPVFAIAGLISCAMCSYTHVQCYIGINAADLNKVRKKGSDSNNALTEGI
jgi:hypothetical protein